MLKSVNIHAKRPVQSQREVDSPSIVSAYLKYWSGSRHGNPLLMNVKFLQFSLLFVLLAAGFASLPARADCDQEDLCEAQLVVTGLLDEIVEQHDVIKAHWKTLYSAQDYKTLSGLYESTLCLVDVVSRYLHIGTLESRLLVAYNKLGSVRTEMGSHDPVCYCYEEILLSASF